MTPPGVPATWPPLRPNAISKRRQMSSSPVHNLFYDGNLQAGIGVSVVAGAAVETALLLLSGFPTFLLTIHR